MASRILVKGDTVRLKPGTHAHLNHVCPEGRDDNHTAQIRACYGDDGECWLDQDLHGCKYWNQSDLELVE